MPKYLIGMVAKTFGFTKEALRFYEREGILIPERDENGYRYYGKPQLQRVAVIKRMQNIGFSLKEISALLTNYSKERLLENLNACIVEKQRELDYQQALLSRLKRDCAYYSDSECFDLPTIVDLPERYAFYFDNVEKLVNDDKIRQDVLRWYDRMYPALGLETLTLADMEHDKRHRRIGLIAERADAVASDFPHTENIYVLPPCRAVHFSTQLLNVDGIFRPFYDVLMKTAQELGVSYQGNVHVIFNFSYRGADGKMVFLVRTFAPILEE